MTFVVTGKLKTFKNRDELKANIEANGGKVTGSVTSKTNYLINNDITSTTAKNKTAKDLGIPIITEEQYLAMKS
jgi:DNA ligase (NAD+)